MRDVLRKRDGKIEVFPFLFWKNRLEEGTEKKEMSTGSAEKFFDFEFAELQQGRIANSQEHGATQEKNREKRRSEKKNTHEVIFRSSFLR